MKKQKIGRTILSFLLVLAAIALTSSVGFAQEAVAPTAGSDESGAATGAVFAMTNETAANRIVVYRREIDGALTRVGRVLTRGLGIGVDTDTQGALVLSPDNRFLYAANPGSDNISVFKVVEGGRDGDPNEKMELAAGSDGTGPRLRLRFLQLVHAGDQPMSMTIFGDLLYVLDSSVAEQGIRGFRIAPDGKLTELPDSFRMLSSPIAVPGEVQFGPNGKIILVTHKTTNVLLTPQNAIDAFTIGDDGYASATPIRNASFGLRPFSLAFRDDGKLVVVEAFNAAPNLSAVSSYQAGPDGTITAISGSVANGQTDVCWVVISKDGRFAFVANFGSGTISSYSFDEAGNLTLLDGDAASLGAMSQPVDLSLSEDGRYLYQLLRGTGEVAAFRIEDDGRLTSLGLNVGGLPVADGASGLASY